MPWWGWLAIAVVVVVIILIVMYILTPRVMVRQMVRFSEGTTDRAHQADEIARIAQAYRDTGGRDPATWDAFISQLERIAEEQRRDLLVGPDQAAADHARSEILQHFTSLVEWAQEQRDEALSNKRSAGRKRPKRRRH